MCDPRGIKDRKRKEREVGGKEAGDGQEPPSAQPRTPSSAPFVPRSGTLTDSGHLTPFPAGWPHVSSQQQKPSLPLFFPGAPFASALASLVQAVFYLLAVPEVLIVSHLFPLFSVLPLRRENFHIPVKA